MRPLLAVPLLFAGVGCQQPSTPPIGTPAVPVAVAPAPNPAPSVEVAGRPPAGKPVPVTDVTDARLAGPEPLTTEEALYLIRGIEEEGDLDRVLAVGEKLFSAFEAILSEPTTSERDQVTVLELVCGMKGDRSHFMSHALRRLTSENGDLRRAAVGFLGYVGSEREAALITVMLLDTNSMVQHAAADALVRIGGERELAVFDIITDKARRYEYKGERILSAHMLDVYAKCRDKLEERLKNAKEAEPNAKPAEKK